MSQYQSKKVVEVLRMIKNQDIVLPAFQREYVWKPEQVEQLFDSLMKGYPINSMLFWKVRKDAKGNYWLCSKGNGIFKMSPRPDGGWNIHNYAHEDGNKWSLSSNSVYQAVEDKQGNIWVATYGGCLL